MGPFWIEAAGFALRWLHVVAAIAWIGESFYFVMLDRSLEAPKTPEPGVAGESWSVHGGGFYHKRKFMPAPPQLPETLHWSKWKSYTTWMSGFALFGVLYLLAPAIYLIDPAVAALSPMQAVLLAFAFPLLAWLVYDGLCRLLGFRDAALGALVALLVLGLSYAATHLFAGRAAYLLVGAALATIMSANVFFVIIPGQKRMVAALARGDAIDPLPGRRGKQRSVHNTYFTLPVVFAMLSNHYAPAFAHAHNWLVLAGFMLAGALIRQFFVLWHSGGRAWWLLAAGAAGLLAMFAWLAPRAAGDSVRAADASIPTTADILPILASRCTACHSAQPTLMPSAPKGAMFDTVAQIDARAALIHQQVAVLRVMPPGNLTGLTDDERAIIARWSAASSSR
ncbi:MAG: urate hydroxylase PuuD [Xanthomonadaceae bacterium]|nr:urate hydroxylase PuuD [Xanthomonadaceae bacterium]